METEYETKSGVAKTASHYSNFVAQDAENVKNIHHILSPKPWDQLADKQSNLGKFEESQDPSHAWWTTLNQKRLIEEEITKVRDQF